MFIFSSAMTFEMCLSQIKPTKLHVHPTHIGSDQSAQLYSLINLPLMHYRQTRSQSFFMSTEKTDLTTLMCKLI